MGMALQPRLLCKPAVSVNGGGKSFFGSTEERRYIFFRDYDGMDVKEGRKNKQGKG